MAALNSAWMFAARECCMRWCCAAPVFGGKVASFDATKNQDSSRRQDVFEISNGVAVVADNTWTAMQGRRASA